MSPVQASVQKRIHDAKGLSDARLGKDSFSSTLWNFFVPCVYVHIILNGRHRQAVLYHTSCVYS